MAGTDCNMAGTDRTNVWVAPNENDRTPNENDVWVAPNEDVPQCRRHQKNVGGTLRKGGEGGFGGGWPYNGGGSLWRIARCWGTPHLNDNTAADETRFEFGENWASFLSSIDEPRIAASIASLSAMLDMERLDDQTFLDVGCGSGLASLAACKMGANVHSFDFDPTSVACTRELRSRYAEATTLWTVEQGSALDEPYLQSLGRFDIVYSWGVLHHTGDMNRAIDLVADRVRSNGLLFIAIYRDQGGASRRWKTIKRFYHRLPAVLRPAWVAAVASIYETKFAAARLARGRNPLPFMDWKQKSADRGMSAWHDWVDWVGGWPFEVAAPEEIINPLTARGFSLQRVKTIGSGWGCNEYVFRRVGGADD